MSTNGQATVTRMSKADRDRIIRRNKAVFAPNSRDRTTGWVNWGELAGMIGQPFDSTRIPISKLHQMRCDPILAFGLQYVKVPLIRAPWYIEARDDQGPRPDVAAVLDGNLRQIYSRYIFQRCNCLDFGFAPLVKNFKIPTDPPTWQFFDTEGQARPAWSSAAMPLLWDNFMSIKPDFAEPHWNSKGEFDGIDWRKPRKSPFYTDSDPEGPDVPLDFALWAVNEKDKVFGSLWGYPRLGYGYRYWWSKWFRWALADRQFEKDADPPLFVRFPDEVAAINENSGEEEEMEDIALRIGEMIRSGATVALPSLLASRPDGTASDKYAWDVGELESRGNLDVYNASFDYLDVALLRSVMVPEQALIEGKGGSSSRNVASTFGDAFQESQAVLMAEIDAELNDYVIPQLVEINWGPKVVARKVTRGFASEDMDLAKQLVQLIGQQDPLSMEVDIREILSQLGIPLLSPDKVMEQRRQLQEFALNSQPPQVEGTPDMPGVTATGFYYMPNERIDLGFSESSSPAVEVVRVERLELAEGEVAVYDEETGTLAVREDLSDEHVNKLLVLLGQRLSELG